MSAAERGFAVTLFEKSDAIGGQFRLAMAVPGKEDFAETLRYYGRRLEVLGVSVRLRTEATLADLALYDEVIVATGVVPRLPDLEGIDHPSVASYADVLSGHVVPGQRVAVVGAGGIGVDVVALPAPRSRPTASTTGWRTGASATRPCTLADSPSPSRARPCARSCCCSASTRRSASTSARPRAGRTGPCSSSPA